MNEVEWAENIKDKINDFLSNPKYLATTRETLIYFQEKHRSR